MKLQQGFIALTSALILGALFLSLVAGATVRGIATTQNDISSMQATVAQSLAYTCAEYALMQITRQLHYAGDEILSMANGQCEILSLAEEIDGTISVHTQGTTKGYVHRVIVEVSTVHPKVIVSAFKSVVTF